MQVSAGVAPAQHSNYTCVKAVITDKFDVQTCYTGSQMWLTYAVNETYPTIPTASIVCIQGKGFSWQKTCDWAANWYIKPNQVLASNTCNAPGGFLQTPGC